MLRPAVLTTLLALAGCQPDSPPTAPAPPPAASPALPDPAAFSAWPSVTERPVPVGPRNWALCRSPTRAELQDREGEAKPHGPHAGYSVVVRVSPGAAAAFRAGGPLPAGAAVVKEKYADELASGPLYGYAVMVKREVGFYPEGGDWEYAFVALEPERAESRGRMAGCAACHAAAQGRDFLFRSYGAGR